MDEARAGSSRGRGLFLLLAIAFWAAVAWSAVRPHHAQDYLIEIATPIAGFIALALTLRRFRFTPIAYALLFLESLVLIVGAHYTHERVPLFDWLRDALGHQRNHYDRFAHFCVGLFLVIPVREILARLSPLRGAWLQALSLVSMRRCAAPQSTFASGSYLLGVSSNAAGIGGAAQRASLPDPPFAATSMLGWAAFYEITEWWIAAATSPETGAAYLGAQGDPWDAQKDMLLDGLGAVLGLLVLGRLHQGQLRRLGQAA